MRAPGADCAPPVHSHPAQPLECVRVRARARSSESSESAPEAGEGLGGVDRQGRPADLPGGESASLQIFIYLRFSKNQLQVFNCFSCPYLLMVPAANRFLPGAVEAAGPPALSRGRPTRPRRRRRGPDRGPGTSQTRPQQPGTEPVAESPKPSSAAQSGPDMIAEADGPHRAARTDRAALNQLAELSPRSSRQHPVPGSAPCFRAKDRWRCAEDQHYCEGTGRNFAAKYACCVLSSKSPQHTKSVARRRSMHSGRISTDMHQDGRAAAQRPTALAP